MGVQSKIILPIELRVDEKGEVDAWPVIPRGIAVEKSEYVAMGTAPGCYGCRAIARGDTAHKPHSTECRVRVMEWLKKQDDPKIHERLTSAQLRLVLFV